MIVRILTVSLLLSLAACSSRPVTAPSTSAIQNTTARLGTKVTVARTVSTSGRARVVSAQRSNENALVALSEGRYEMVRVELEQASRDLIEARAAFDRVTIELMGAEVDVENLQRQTQALQKEIDRLAKQAADDAVIAARCKSFFGLGAIFYGVERLVKTGLVGILILILAVVVLLALGGGSAAFVFRGLAWLRSLRQKPPLPPYLSQ